ncbi:hypothetical protein Tco_0927059 [Tanacetum coccineum]|uniref:Uncharacterized protein n=1 Tax=Tanacetum coccineum TaxID=301880 RepID=A0ABQ5DCJ8_9ASTR
MLQPSKRSRKLTEDQNILLLLSEALPRCGPSKGLRYGSVKNHKKTVKNGQARTRESEEYKAEARKVKPQSKIVNHGQ